MEFHKLIPSRFISTLALTLSISFYSSTALADINWLSDTGWQSEDSYIGDYQPWEYDDCLRNERGRADPYQYQFTAINSQVDMMSGSINLSETDYNSGQDVLPLKLERVYKTAGSYEAYGRARTKWFTSIDYRLNENAAIISATRAYEHPTQQEACDGYYGYGDMPLVLAQGTAGTLSLYGKVNDTTGIVEWFKRKQRGSGYYQVNLTHNSDGSWTYYDAETSTIQQYDSKGRILSITEAATHLALVWTYDGSYTKITRTGGEWLKILATSGGLQTVQTSSGNVYKYSNGTNNGTDYLKVVYPNGDYKSYDYYSSKLLKSVNVSGVGITQQWTWNKEGLVTSSKITDGDTTTFAYTGLDARIIDANTEMSISATNAAGRVTTFTFNVSSGNLLNIKGSDGSIGSTLTSFSHALTHNGGLSEIVQATDPLGSVKESTTDIHGWIVSEKLGVGTADETETNTTWMEKWHLPQKVEDDLSATTYTYYSKDRPLVTSVVSTDKVTGQSKTTTFKYDFYSNGLISKITTDGPRTDTQDISYQYYSSNGRLTKTVDALGHTTNFTSYDTDGHLVKIVYPDGTSKSTQYNNRGWITQENIINESGSSNTKYEYDSRGNIVKQTAPDNVVVTKKYNGANNLSYIIRGEEKKSFTYNNIGKLLTESITPSASGSNYHVTTTYEHDALGRLVRVTTQKGQVTRYIYDILNRRLNTIDGNNYVTETLVYDSLGRVKSNKDAIGRINKYDYDSHGNLVTLTDNAGRIFRSNYNGFDEVISSDSPTEGHKSFDYDEAGNLTSTTLNDGSSIDYTYDALNRMLSRSTSDGKSDTFSYDETTSGVGLISKTTEESGFTEYEYNSPKRDVSRQVFNISGNVYELKYGYDNGGRLTSMTYPSGYTVTYGYDARNGKLVSIKDTSGNNLVSNISYNLFGPIKSYNQQAIGNVDFIRYVDYQLRSIASSKYNVEYIYGKAGHIVKKLDGNGNILNQYTYYNNYELKSEIIKGYQVSYQYDKIGNRALESGFFVPSSNGGSGGGKGGDACTCDGIEPPISSPMSSSPSTSFTSLAVTSAQTASFSVGNGQNIYSYDTKGKLIRFNSTPIGYDDRGNITSDTLHGTSTKTYNALNQLTRSRQDIVDMGYQYDALGHRTVKRNNRLGSSSDIHFIYDKDGVLLAESQNGKITKEYIYLGHSLISVRYNGASYPVMTDITGRPEIVTNSSGTVVWKADNNAFDRTVSTNSFGGLNIGYPGQYFDGESSTWYNINRNYDGKIGRYLQSDPKGTIDGPNTYVYAGNNPVNRVDPTGEYFWVIVGAAVDIGLQAYENGWDFSKVDYLEVAASAVNPAKIFSLGAKGYKIAQEARQAAKAGAKALSEARGTVAKGSGAVSADAGKVVQETSKDVTKGGRKLPFADKDRLTEINKTLDRIDGNGPFPHKRDGITFKNREGKLPEGNYKEYTVDTPEASNRGARRIVKEQDTGNTYYTDDHYENFIQIDPRKY